MSSQDETKIWEALLAQAEAMDEAAPDPNELAELACGTGLDQSRRRTSALAIADPRLLRDAQIERRIHRASRYQLLRRGGLVAAALLISLAVGHQIAPAPMTEAPAGTSVAAADTLITDPLLRPIADEELVVFRGPTASQDVTAQIAWPRGFSSLGNLACETTRPANSSLEIVDTLTGAVVFQSSHGAPDPQLVLGTEHVGLALEARILAKDGRILARSAFGVTDGGAALPAATQRALDQLTGPVRTQAEVRAYLRMGYYRAAAEALQGLKPEEAPRARRLLAAKLAR